MLRILLVEDDEHVRTGIARALSEVGHRVTEAADGARALERLSAEVFDAVVCDLRLPKVDGLGVFRAVRRLAVRTDVILMTSYAAVSEAVQALKDGADDYLTKPFDPDELVFRLGAIARRRQLEKDLEEARSRLAAGHDEEILGTSPAMAKVLDRVATVARSDAPVLVTGESGTGKELVARRLHALSARASGPWLAVNCAAFPETLIEAELFGYERGAFTGATKRREGRFQAAHGGTLLLDEIGEMPLSTQAKLLRVLQDGAIEPLGTNTPVRVDVRLVSATNRDLKRAIAEGRFREDLFYRVNGVELRLPPLRDRAGDLPLLVSHFLARALPAGQPAPEVSLRAWQALAAYPFPGNVRELAHAVQHAAILSRGGRIDIEHLPDEVVQATQAASPGGAALPPLAAVLDQAERQHLLRALAVAGGKRVRAAELLGISRKTLWEKLRAHGIADGDLDDAR